MEGKDILSMLLQGGTTAIGAAAGGPAGAAIGGGIGQAVSSGIDLLTDKPSYGGPSPEELTSLFIAGQNAESAYMMDGLGADEVSRITQAGRSVENRAMAEYASMFRQLSPYDSAKLTDSLMARSANLKSETQDKISSYMSGSKARNLLSSIQANQSFANIAKSVEQARLQKRLLTEQSQKKMEEQFSLTISNLAKAFAGPALDFNNTDNGGITVGTKTESAEPTPQGPERQQELMDAPPAKTPQYADLTQFFQDFPDTGLSVEDESDLFSILYGG